jgi:hypothetical protein
MKAIRICRVELPEAERSVPEFRRFAPRRGRRNRRCHVKMGLQTKVSVSSYDYRLPD